VTPTCRSDSIKSELSGANRYAMSRRAALTRYRDDGSNAGGDRAAAVVTLGTAKLNVIDPQA
jgi:hypothetical protein